jgi:hypothetical protein
MPILIAFAVLLLQAQRSAPPPVPPEVLAQFDFLDGEWDFVYTAPGPDGKPASSKGRWSGRRLADGHVVEDSWVLTDDQGKPRGLGIYTFRAFNRTTGKWQYKSLNVTSGLWQDGTAEKVGSEMHLLQSPPPETPNGNWLRIRYYNITPTAFSWSGDVSTDGGKTWQPELLHIEAKRPQK